MGQSFAENDRLLQDPEMYVLTPAYSAATTFGSNKFFFVGRRGMGKTALRLYLSDTPNTSAITPTIFSPASIMGDNELFREVSKKHFRSIVSAFRRALQVEMLVHWVKDKRYVAMPAIVEDELAQYGRMEFDTRAIRYVSRILRLLTQNETELWVAENVIHKQLADAMREMSKDDKGGYTLLVDSIDDHWEGSDAGLIYLTAFMHACLEMSSQIPWVRALTFLRENVFERVRAVDTESSRLETAVVGMDWTSEALTELVERRLNHPFGTKIALGGPTFDAWFEESEKAKEHLFRYCQHRPRDFIIFVEHAISGAQAHRHERIHLHDLHEATRRFSDSRLRDLGDEYQENYPGIDSVLTRFSGLGTTYTLGGLQSFIRKLLSDRVTTEKCGNWLFDAASTVEGFARILYGIGFVGFKRKDLTKFRALGPQDTTPPAISDDVDIVIHPSYWDALDLRELLVRSLPDDTEFGRIGILTDLPDGISEDTYNAALDELAEDLQTLPLGTGHAAEFEDIVGRTIKLCLYRTLENVEAKSRDVDGKTIRDWVAANRASTGFWHDMKLRFQAFQVTWECKNYATLKARDFQQAHYYMSAGMGHFVVLAFRGNSVSPSDRKHIKRILSEANGGMVLPLTEKDLLVLIRQARSGKIREEHIRDRFDDYSRSTG